MLVHPRGKSELQKICKSLNQSDFYKIPYIIRSSLSVVNGSVLGDLKIQLLKYVVAAKKQAIV